MLIAVLFIVGFYPAILIDVINTGVVPLVDKINGVSTIAKAGM